MHEALSVLVTSLEKNVHAAQVAADILHIVCDHSDNVSYTNTDTPTVIIHSIMVLHSN